MKHPAISAIVALTMLRPLTAPAQVQGTSYYLPKTAIRLVLLVEKTSYTPGDFAIYAERYMKENVETEPAQTYRIISTQIESFGVPDTEKQYTARMDQKVTISSIDKDDSGILIGVNTTGNRSKERQHFTPARQPARLNPRDYMTQDILAAGSTAKMAELTALEIFDIRENRNLLNKGQADFMPQDGEQLRLMLDNLDTQERALTQLFYGLTTKDTTETEIVYIPEEETQRDVVFRFSEKLGIVDSDDLAGSPYYVAVTDLNKSANNVFTLEDTATYERDNSGINVCLPGKIQVTLGRDNRALATYELYAAQFGHIETLNTNLFNKKNTTKIRLSSVTGNAEHVETVILR